MKVSRVLSIIAITTGLLASDVQAADPEIITEPVCSGGIHYIDRTHKGDREAIHSAPARIDLDQPGTNKGPRQ